MPCDKRELLSCFLKSPPKFKYIYIYFKKSMILQRGSLNCRFLGHDSYFLGLTLCSMPPAPGGNKKYNNTKYHLSFFRTFSANIEHTVPRYYLCKSSPRTISDSLLLSHIPFLLCLAHSHDLNLKHNSTVCRTCTLYQLRFTLKNCRLAEYIAS